MIQRPAPSRLIMNPKAPNRATRLLDGESSGILNWDDIAYPSFNRIYKQLKANFWVPEEVSLSDDHRSYRNLNDDERDTFNYLMGLLSALDTPQSRIMFEAARLVTDPAAQSNLIFVAQQEVVHNQSYSYILSSLVPKAEQDLIFNRARTDTAIHERNEYIMSVYNRVLNLDERFDNKPVLFAKLLVAALALEGIHFYGAFAFFYNLARQNKMVGTSTIISYINKDELVHTKFMTELLLAVTQEHPEVLSILPDLVRSVLTTAVNGELKLMELHISRLPGMDWSEFRQYVKYRANKIARMVGVSEIYPGISDNGMPWIRAYVDNFDNVKTDFFEGKVRQYAKVGADDGLDEI